MVLFSCFGPNGVRGMTFAVHTHPYFSILLGYRHDISYPFGLVYGFDEPYFQLLCDFLLNLKEPFGSHAPRFFLDRHHVGMSINVMLYYLGINARHIFINHAKTSWNSVRNFLRSFFSCSFRVEPILIKRGFSSLPK